MTRYTQEKEDLVSLSNVEFEQCWCSWCSHITSLPPLHSSLPQLEEVSNFYRFREVDHTCRKLSETFSSGRVWIQIGLCHNHLVIGQLPVSRYSTYISPIYYHHPVVQAMLQTVLEYLVYPCTFWTHTPV